MIKKGFQLSQIKGLSVVTNCLKLESVPLSITSRSHKLSQTRECTFKYHFSFSSKYITNSGEISGLFSLFNVFLIELSFEQIVLLKKQQNFKKIQSKNGLPCTLKLILFFSNDIQYT